MESMFRAGLDDVGTLIDRMNAHEVIIAIPTASGAIVRPRG